MFLPENELGNEMMNKGYDSKHTHTLSLSSFNLKKKKKKEKNVFD